MSCSDHSEILELAERTVPRAWRMLESMTTSFECSMADLGLIGEIGHELDRLAYDLRNAGFDVPWRLTYAIAFLFNALSERIFQPSSEIVHEAIQTLAILREALLEIDLPQEPLETVVELSPKTLAELNRDGEELVVASELLLHRIQRDQSSPYAAPASRIHFLAVSLRDRLSSGTRNASTNSVIHPNIIEFQTAEPLIRSQRVLIVDESPFIRLLLSSAINAAGYATQAAANIAELVRDSDSVDQYGIVLWGGVRSVGQTDQLLNWIRDQDRVSETTIIGLIDRAEVTAKLPNQVSLAIARTDLSGLLNQITTELGPASNATRKTA